jgi:hypothetical protein
MSHDMTGQVQSATTSHLERIINDHALLKREFADPIGHVKGGAVRLGANVGDRATLKGRYPDDCQV